MLSSRYVIGASKSPIASRIFHAVLSYLYLKARQIMSKMQLRYADISRAKRIDWYRSPMDRAILRSITRRSNIRGGFQAFGHLGLLTGTGILTVSRQSIPDTLAISLSDSISYK